MTGIEWLPTALRVPHGRDLAWTSTTHPKGVLHTTESFDWPTYRNWTVEPHVTVKPVPGVGIVIHQHVPFSRASFSLVHAAGATPTNTARAFQIELIGTSAAGGPGYYWPDADDVVLAALYAELIEPLSTSYGIPVPALSPVAFQAYPASYGPKGASNTVRLSQAAWDVYTGWCGHQHVPENVHGDPGAFPWARMMEAVMLTPADKAWIQSAISVGVAAAVTEVLTTSKIVRNIPTVAGQPEGPLWTVTAMQAQTDVKLDRLAPIVAEILANTTPAAPAAHEGNPDA
jgi:hypothetical protein